MKSMQIFEDDHKKLKEYAAKKGMTIKGVIMMLVKTLKDKK